MPYKDPEKQKAAQRKHYLEQKARGRNSGNEAKQHRKEFVLRYKMLPGVKCACGEGRWQCLQFHHRHGEKKVDSIAHMCRRGVNMKALKAEIRKCDVVCANCHAVTHNGYNWKEISKKKWAVDVMGACLVCTENDGFESRRVHLAKLIEQC